jgi:hypothetical protein
MRQERILNLTLRSIKQVSVTAARSSFSGRLRGLDLIAIHRANMFVSAETVRGHRPDLSEMSRVTEGLE